MINCTSPKSFKEACRSSILYDEKFSGGIGCDGVMKSRIYISLGAFTFRYIARQHAMPNYNCQAKEVQEAKMRHMAESLIIGEWVGSLSYFCCHHALTRTHDLLNTTTFVVR